MNIKLPIVLTSGFVILAGIFVALTPQAEAVSVAEQTQQYSSSLDVWQAIQELGHNLSGTAESFTFRVSTSISNINQFDFTAQNSRIYDKTANTYIVGCVSDTSNPTDKLRGLTFTTTGVPAGYEDVTVDFSCHNYDFIPGHRYLILLSNANMARWGGMKMRLGSASYTGTSNDYFSEAGLRYSFDSSSCNASQYVWNSQKSNSGCNIFGTPKDDLYFILSNNSPPPPPPKLPVIFIPGIGGSELKASQDIIWSKDDGHGGEYQHGYTANEKIWVNQDEAVKLGNDDYFDILRLKSDGITSEADLSLTGNLTSFGYPDIDSFFTDMGYIKGTNYFVFPYDWRKDIKHTKDSLDNLIEEARQKSGQSQVNLVVHSMGGLVARYYISDSTKASKVNKLIELGVPHIGAVSALKTLMYGTWLARDLYLFKLGIVPSEVKDVFQNLPSGFQLLPSKSFFNYYDNSDDLPYPFRDDRDIDNNKTIGSLNFNQIKTLLANLNYNMPVFKFGEEFHDNLDPALNQTNGTKIYIIVGTSQPTLGQIHETWWITWPVNLIPKTDEIFINGDGTVPLYSASLKNDSQDLSGAEKIYYVDQEHGNLVSNNGTAMQTVKAILNEDNSLPVEVKDQRIVLEGEQLSLDDGKLNLYDNQNRHCGLNDNEEIEENIPDVICTTSGNTKHAFVKKKAKKVKVKVTRKKPATKSKTTTVRKRTYKQDKISKTVIYKDIIITEKGKIEFDLDPSVDTTPSFTFYPDSEHQEDTIIINPTSQASGNTALDQTPPSTSIQISGAKDPSGIYTGPVTITLTGSDLESGILRIEYSLDNGQTVQIYTQPFTISAAGKTTIQVKSVDLLGNEEIPQSVIIEIAAAPTPTPAPTPSPAPATSSTPDTSGANSDNTETTSKESRPTFEVNNSDVLGITFENPGHISDQINVSKLLDRQENSDTKKITTSSATETLGGLLVVSGGIITIASLGLIATFLKPIPK